MSSPPPPGPGGVYQGGEYGSGAQPPGAQPQQPAGPPPFQPQGPGYPPPQQQPGPGFPPPQQPPGGQFQVPQQFPPGGAPGAKPKKRGAVIGAIGGVAGLVIIVIIGFVVRSVLGGADVPEVGDCVDNPANPNDIEVVDCSSADAAWEVIGLDGEMTEAEFDAASNEEVCTTFPDWEQAIWYNTSGDNGEVVCLVASG